MFSRISNSFFADVAEASLLGNLRLVGRDTLLAGNKWGNTYFHGLKAVNKLYMIYLSVSYSMRVN